MATLTLKQEAFCSAYMETGNASEAYRQAYDAENMSSGAIEVEACRLLAHPKVALRIAERREAMQQRHEITADFLTAQLMSALNKAMSEAKGASAAVSAVVALGKLHGLIVEKKHVTGKLSHEHSNSPESVPESLGWLADLAKASLSRKAAVSLPN